MCLRLLSTMWPTPPSYIAEYHPSHIAENKERENLPSHIAEKKPYFNKNYV